MTVLDGFLIATLFGVFGTFELWSLTSIWAAFSRMSSPPHPALRPTGAGNLTHVGTDPEESPVQILSSGCMTILLHLLLQAIVLGGLGIFFLSMPEATAQQLFPETGSEECVVGAVSAAVLAVVLRTMVLNSRAIGNLYHKMVSPPDPALPKANAVVAAAGAAAATPSGGAAAAAVAVISPDPPNVHYVGATPTISPLDVIGQGCLEIAGRLILQVFLVGVLGLWGWLVYGYLFLR